MVESAFLGFDLYSYFYALVRQIPPGMVTTYGDLADALGDRVAARACGYMLSINPDPDGTPCYRVVPHDGSLGNYTHPLGPQEKRKRLERDGIRISHGKIDNFERLRFNDFRTDHPLIKMQREQEKLSELYTEEIDCDGSIGAVDVSYGDFSGIGSAVIEDGEHHLIKSVMMDVNFPYIPGYLFYREFPFIRSLLKTFHGTILIDGNGRLHPRAAGLATLGGILLNTRTIGVAKSRLMGKVVDNWVLMGNRRVASLLSKNIIVSAGHGIDVDSSVSFVKKVSGGKYPVILKEAHNSCTRTRKATVFH